MKKKAIIITAAAVLIAAAGVVTWQLTSGFSGDSQTLLYAESVGKMTNTDMSQNRFAGVIEAQNALNINLENNQTVKEIFVTQGQTVEVGTELFSYNTDEISMNLEQANLEVEKITNSIESLKSQIESLKKEKANAPSSEQLSYTTQIQELEMNVRQEEYNKKVKELEVSRLKDSLENSVVTSTIDGVVQEINENPSYDQYTGNQKPFMSILATGKYRVKGTVNELSVRSIYRGMPVIIRSRADESIIWSGTVDNIDTQKPETGNQNMMGGESGGSTKYPFYVSLESSDGLMLGQHVYIEPNLGENTEKEGMWLLSDYIITEENGESYVWAVGNGDKLEKRKVTLGEKDENDSTVEILDGLKASDYIVWPSEDCKEGAKVSKNNNEMPIGGGSDGIINGDDGGYVWENGSALPQEAEI